MKAPIEDIVMMFPGQVQPSPGDEVDRAEAHFGTKFPAGYREFISRFGPGTLNNWVRVYPPDRMIAEVESEFRPRWDEYFFWDDEPEITKEQVLTSVIFADTLEGDEFIFLPGQPEAIYILQRNDSDLPLIGKDLASAVAWTYEHIIPGQEPIRDYFTPFGTTNTAVFRGEADWEDVRKIVDSSFTNPLVLSDDVPDDDADEDEEKEWYLDMSPSEFEGEVVVIGDEDSEITLMIRYVTEEPPPVIEGLAKAVGALGLEKRD